MSSSVRDSRTLLTVAPLHDELSPLPIHDALGQLHHVLRDCARRLFELARSQRPRGIGAMRMQRVAPALAVLHPLHRPDNLALAMDVEADRPHHALSGV